VKTKLEPLQIIKAVAHLWDFANPKLNRNEAKREATAISAYLIKKHLSLSYKDIGDLLCCSWKEAQEHCRWVSSNKTARLKGKNVLRNLEAKNSLDDEYDFTFRTRDNKKVTVKISIS
jgi:hypothetical protein